MIQQKYPERSVFIAGDCVTFRLHDMPDIAGHAFLRTTIGSADAEREEQIELTEAGRPKHGLAWRDLPMRPDGHGAFVLELPLTEVGIFEAKCYFAPADGGKMLWGGGGNFRLKVESAANLCGNSIYCAFVRQFDADAAAVAAANEPQARALDAQRYTVIPPSGTFRALIGRLDHIFNTLGCRILQLLPIHPIPTVYGRMGRYGSPFASLDYFSVDPALAEFDRGATPMEQFCELVDAVHARRGRIFLDIPVNHTGWASQLQDEHPEYFARRPDHTFESPGAWGVVWEDLCKLNYAEPKVHHLMARVFLHWCRHGVDGFRCDAGYMLPAAAWDYIVARVRAEYPDTVFLLEGLGGKISVQEKLLGESGLDWAYSELFQNYSRDEISSYQPYMESCSHHFGALVSFAETHDNLRLAAQSPEYAAMRCSLCALLSCGGAFGFANGVEFFATERIDVHGNGALNWGHEPNLVPLLQRLNALLACHGAFFADSSVQLVQRGPGNLIAAHRKGRGGHEVLALVNLDLSSPAQAHWPAELFFAERVFDLLRGRDVRLGREGGDAVVSLAPGEALCLTCDAADLNMLERQCSRAGEPEAVTAQRANALGYRIWQYFEREGVPDFNVGEELRRNPLEYCRFAAQNELPGVVRYDAALDLRRIVMLAPGDLLLVESQLPFRIELQGSKRIRVVGESMSRIGAHGEFALLPLPCNTTGQTHELTVHLTVFDPQQGNRRGVGKVIQLAEKTGKTPFRMRYHAGELRERNLHAFCANHRGGMTLTCGAWGELFSKYDALLAANGPSAYPVDRRVMLTRLRGWLVADEYSQALDLSVMCDFAADCNNRAQWRFMVPSGRGRLTPIEIRLTGALDGDAVKLEFCRCADAGTGESPEVKIILRPDLENRSNHQLTKAFLGPEADFPRAVTAYENGFRFTPGDLSLTVRLSRGQYVVEPEWRYMVDLPLETYYGQEHNTDLFSPGYLEFTLVAGECAELFAAVDVPGRELHPEMFEWPHPGNIPNEMPQLEALREAMRPFVVRRDKFHTVIAGYPWFLDWGRDTLIALRGLIRGGYQEIAAGILRQFASFEENGTIPNIIHGNTVGNRDTSDAPLWLGVAARDYVDFYHDNTILDADCSGRPFRAVLHSIVEHYMAGTPNGIRADHQSMLIFSPAHFTWMDTNYPAGTPREGYPIEIQALWCAMLDFLGRDEMKYRTMAQQVRLGIEKFFFRPELGRFSDCLHCTPGTPAAHAVADDHIRCNQLLALTLGAVRDRVMQLAILAGAEELLIPGSIRSLSARHVEYRLPVSQDGKLLNDPSAPYWGRYRGPEDTSRKAAYHNGTAWGWVFPSYCEGLVQVGGAAQRDRALSLLESVAFMADCGVPGQLPEVADGDAPHTPGGCPAQAWSVTEAFRVMDWLTKM